MEKAQARRISALAGAASLAIGLAGCNDLVREADASAPTTTSSRLLARSGVSPSGASVAFVTIEGAPSAVVARFSQQTAAEAARREVSVTDVSRAHYLVRGYLSAYAVEGGAAIGYVWDVFDKSHRRVQRSEDMMVVRGAGDPWSLASDQALASLAAKSADDLAAVLSNTPEAQIASRQAPAATAIAATAQGVPAPQAPAGLRAYR